MPAKHPSAFEAEADEVRNILRVRFAGKITAAHLQAGSPRVESLVALLRTGFAAVTDLSDLDAMSLDCAPELVKMMELYRTRGIGKVIRLIPDPHKDIGFNILSATHYRGKVQVITCETLAEVERALA